MYMPKFEYPLNFLTSELILFTYSCLLVAMISPKTNAVSIIASLSDFSNPKCPSEFNINVVTLVTPDKFNCDKMAAVVPVMECGGLNTGTCDNTEDEVSDSKGNLLIVWLLFKLDGANKIQLFSGFKC